MPADPQAFLKEWKDQMIDAIVEQVRDGSTLRVRLLLSDALHQIISITLAGVKCPKFGRDNEPNEQFAEEVGSTPPNTPFLMHIAFLGQVFHRISTSPATCSSKTPLPLRTTSPPILFHQHCPYTLCCNLYWYRTPPER